MNFTREAIVELILNGPRTSKDNANDFDELVESYMESFTESMNEDDADLAFGFSDWISDIYYESWHIYDPSAMDVKDEGHAKGPETDSYFPSLANITTTRTKRSYTEKEDIEILKFLTKHRKFSQTKDDKLWSLMESNNVNMRRSGQSMKDRFNKKIIPNLTLKLLCAIYVELL